jgi:DNA-binding transcriptional LysR family regulator
VDLIDTRLWIEPLLLVGRPGSLSAMRDSNGNLPLREIGSLPVIMPCQRHAIRRLVDAAFDRQHLRFKPAIEANGALMILQLVKAGFGYTLMPSNRVYPWVESGELEAIGIRPVLRRTMSVITRTAVLDDPRVASLREVVLSLAPAITSRKQFGQTTLCLIEAARTIDGAMPDRHSVPVRTALVSA